MVVEVHQQIPGLLGHPRRSRVVGDAQDMDAAGRVFDNRQAAHLSAVEQIDGEEVGSDDGLGLSAQELCPGPPSPPRCGVDPGLGKDLPHRGEGNADAEAGKLAVDAPVAPAWIFAGHPQDQTTDVPPCGWPARAARPGCGGPSAASRSRCQRNTVSGVTSSRNPARRALGITPASAAISARSAHVSLGLCACYRCSTAS
jgi:hypothetical protein